MQLKFTDRLGLKMARIEQTLKIRDRMASAIRELYSMAEICKWSHSKILEYKQDKFSKFPKVPRWVNCYVSGIEDEIRKNLYKDKLIFGGYVDGQFMSAWRDHAEYYEAKGITAQEYNEKVQNPSHYWASPVNGEYKIF